MNTFPPLWNRYDLKVLAMYLSTAGTHNKRLGNRRKTRSSTLFCADWFSIRKKSGLAIRKGFAIRNDSVQINFGLIASSHCTRKVFHVLNCKMMFLPSFRRKCFFFLWQNCFQLENIIFQTRKLVLTEKEKCYWENVPHFCFHSAKKDGGGCGGGGGDGGGGSFSDDSDDGGGGAGFIGGGGGGGGGGTVGPMGVSQTDVVVLAVSYEKHKTTHERCF